MTHIVRSLDHQYTYEGVTYPGVTGLLKVLDKSDALMSWAARNTAEAAVTLAKDYDLAFDMTTNEPSKPTEDNPHLWRTHSALDKLLQTVGDDGTIRALTSRSAWKRDEAAALGTEVHNLADLVVRGQPTPPMGETTRHRVLKYAEWWKASGWTLRVSEAMLVNPTVGYGGTLDLLARDRDGKTVLADIKTGKGIYWEAVLQLTAYGNARFIEHAGTIYPMPIVDRLVILHVTAEGVREVEVPLDGLAWDAFLACIELTKWRETTKGKRL